MQSSFVRVAASMLVVLAFGCGGGPPETPDSATPDAATPDAGACVGDDACDDGLFCNGHERCDPHAMGADARGCTPARALPCLAGQLCDEAMDRCAADCAVEGDADHDGVRAVACGGTDCDDSDPNRFPGNPELCDPSHDEDCDPTTYGRRDRDRDGFDDATCANGVGSMRSSGDDCDDLHADVSPSGTETCNGRDDDCDGANDEGALLAGFADADGDLHGDPSTPLMACPGAGRFAIGGDDCDDTSPVRHPAQVEICDGIDNDCDTLLDEGTAPVAWYPDTDGDGYGRASDPAAIRVQCAPLAGYSILWTDCDDAMGSRHPGAIEVCDGLDDDCNGLADFRIGPNDFEDDDADGFVDVGCGAFGDDCADGEASVHPGAAELCDLRDDDCDAMIDEMPVSADWYLDRDGDGAGEIGGMSVSSCTPQPGRVLVQGDCDDSRVSYHPGAPDTCDGHDEDCDGRLDEDSATAFFVDADGDGAGTSASAPMLACARPAGYSASPGDCDDTNPARGPGATELCDGADDDCDTMIDEGAASACGAGASATCVSGACMITSCIAPYLDCDATASDGCEVDPRTDPLHCGSCTACPARPGGSAACAASVCGVTCDAGLGDCDGDLTNGCELPVTSDVLNCGGCARRCSPRTNAEPVCSASTCTIACHAGYLNCDGSVTNGCEVWGDADAANCGACGRVCSAGDICALGDCFAAPFDRTLATTALVVSSGTMTLPRGPHYYTSITIMAGATLITDGDGVLELFSTGDVVVDGTIDLSGGNGGVGAVPPSGTCDGTLGLNGGGGATGTTLAGAAGSAGVCALGGGGGTGGTGGNGGGTPCASAGAHGGGSGGTYGAGRYGGGGGGGYAGGGGACGQSGGVFGGDGGSVAGLGTGGAGGRDSGAVAFGGDRALGAPYAGSDSPTTYYGGAGGSIGAAAAADLAVASTFYPGSGGGGGGGTCWGGSGGGGGGGALRIVSLTSITIRGAVRADGGSSGSSAGAQAGGGGGSGGVIVLSSPDLLVAGAVSARGGRSNAPAGEQGGDGGLGRIRISTIPTRCDLTSGTYTPALASGCAPTPGTGTAGRTYIGVWPL